MSHPLPSLQRIARLWALVSFAEATGRWPHRASRGCLRVAQIGEFTQGATGPSGYILLIVGNVRKAASVLVARRNDRPNNLERRFWSRPLLEVAPNEQVF